jgi:hypothetical protein
MTIGSIGAASDITAAIISGDGGGTNPFACVVGSVDAAGNTIASCGYAGQPLTTGQMIANAPQCMPGDMLSFQAGNWVCVPSAAPAASGLPGWLIPALIGIGVLAFMGAKR